MSTKRRILFIANEISPYLELTEFADTVNKLAIKSNNADFEVRCIMPRFGVINERRHRLHEVVRLSGINIAVGDDDYPLQIKVASLPSVRLQVYFLDNEDLFKRKFVFNDEHDNWFEDNALRTIFFCKGAIETVKKFGWPPDVIHCSGWMTGLIPMYLKTLYKKEPVFTHSKIIYTIGQNTFKEKLGANFKKIVVDNVHLKDKDFEPFKEGNNAAMFKGGSTYADAISFGSEKVDKKLVETFAKVKGKKVLPFKSYNDDDLIDYVELYNSLSQ